MQLVVQYLTQAAIKLPSAGDHTRSSVQRWCINFWDITSLASVQVVGFFDVAARL